MGRKGNWFSSVKKALSPDSKEKKSQASNSNNSKKKWFGKQKHPSADSTSLETNIQTLPPPPPPPIPNPQPEVVNFNYDTNEEKNNHHPSSSEVAITLRATEEAPSQVIPEVTTLPSVTRFPGKSTAEVAAIKIQTAYRGYMARRASRALRGLLRLKTLMEGSVVKRQAVNTLKCMQTLSRVQSEIRFRRVRMMEENQALQKQLLQKHAKELENLRIGEEWDDSSQSKEQIEANLLSKYEASMRRERALAYAFTHQKNLKNSSRSINPLFMDPTNPTWGWSWLERWMAARPWEATRGPHDKDNDHSSVKSISASRTGIAGDISKSYARYLLNSSETNSPTAASPKVTNNNINTFQSPSTPVKRASPGDKKLKSPSPRASWGTGPGPSPDDDSKSVTSMQSDRLRRHSVGGSSVRDDESMASSQAVPTYMTPTQSAKAKSRLQSSLGVEKSGTPEKGSSGVVKKRLSYPPSSPAGNRWRSGSPKMESGFKAENGISNGVS